MLEQQHGFDANGSPVHPESLGEMVEKHDLKPIEDKKPRVRSKFYAVVRSEQSGAVLVSGESRKALEANLDGLTANDIVIAFRGKIKLMTPQSKVSL